MAGKHIIKKILLEKKILAKDFAGELGTTPEKFSGKMHRDKFTFEEMIDIADKLNCDIVVVDRDTGRTFAE